MRQTNLFEHSRSFKFIFYHIMCLICFEKKYVIFTLKLSVHVTPSNITKHLWVDLWKFLRQTCNLTDFQIVCWFYLPINWIDWMFDINFLPVVFFHHILLFLFLPTRNRFFLLQVNSFQVKFFSGYLYNMRKKKTMLAYAINKKKA